MGSTVPRWEWRTFGSDFGEAEGRVRRYPAERRESTDLYIVSDRSDDTNTKIRQGLLDVKALQQMDSRGLELWLPMMKASFPLSPGSIAAVFGAWGLMPPALDQRTWSLQVFLAEVVAPQPSLRAVTVGKVRFTYSIDGCLVELGDLTFDGTPMRTLAVEMTDADLTWRTVEALGLASYESMNYVTALKRFLGVSTH